MREVALAIVLSVISLPVVAETLRVGGALVEFDPARFRIEAQADDGATLACITTECTRYGGRPPSIYVSSGPASIFCQPLDIRPSRRENLETVMVGGLTFQVFFRDSGCRARSPGMTMACGMVGPSQLRMSNGSLGCSTAAPIPRAMLLELVKGVRPAP